MTITAQRIGSGRGVVGIFGRIGKSWRYYPRNPEEADDSVQLDPKELPPDQFNEVRDLIERKVKELVACL